MTEVSEIREKIKEAKTIMSKTDLMDNDGVAVPELSWILFLKVFDYHEKQRVALIKGYKTILPEECQWDSWAADQFKGYSGKDLERFVDGVLIEKLSKLTGTKDNRNIDIINSIFNGFRQSLSGTKLRQVINKLNEIKLENSNDLKNLGLVFDEELIKMRDFEKKKASFFTPRPIIRFIVNKIKPDLKKSEKIMDLASGTSGFLVESIKYMKKDVKGKEDEKNLSSLVHGNEKKSRNYLLGMLNLMLQDIGTPNLLNKNTLATTKIRDIVTDDQKYDVIMTNPTFDEKEESEVADNLPRHLAISNSRLHFLYFAMKSLKENGRCALILDNNIFFADSGVPYEMKKELMENYNLHTIVRLPPSAFEPYNGIQTNILFFDAGKPTKDIWFYRMKIRDGLKKYSMNNPMQDSDFDEVLKWFKNKEENDYGYKVSVKDLKNYNLERKHPDDEEIPIDMSPHELISQIIANEKKTLTLLTDVENLINQEIPK